MFTLTGSNLFGQWPLGNAITTEFQEISFKEKTNLSHDEGLIKLTHIGWSYNILKIEKEFYISGSFRGKDKQFVKVSLPEECSNGDDYNMVGNDYNLILISRNNLFIWVIDLENDNKVKKLNLNVDGPVQMNAESSKKMKLDDQIIKTAVSNNSCLHLTAKGIVYSGLLPSYLDTSHCIGKVCDIDCGYEHFVLLTDIGRVYTWGNGRRLQLGHGDLNNLENPTEIEALAGLKIVKISAGGWHSLALSDSGDLYAWGWNDTGQLGIKSFNDNDQGVPNTELKSYHIPTLIDLFGENNEEINLNVKDIACGSRHSAILLEDDTVWVTGCNQYGQLGLPETQPSVKCFKKVFQSTMATKVVCGPWSTVLIKNN